MAGENMQKIPSSMSMPDTGLVKKVVQVPLYWNPRSMFFSSMGPRTKASMRELVGNPP